MSAESKDLYALLGVDLSATPQRIRRAYRRRIVYSHRQGVLDMVDQIDALKQAYQTLRDPALRRDYDVARSTWHWPAFPPERGTDSAIAREVKLRARMASERTRQSVRSGATAHRETAETVRQLTEEHDQRELRHARARAHRAFRGRVVRALFICSLLAVALYFGLR